MFVHLLLTHMSGVNLLDVIAKQRWGDAPRLSGLSRKYAGAVSASAERLNADSQLMWSKRVLGWLAHMRGVVLLAAPL